jgi:hypothetical protein
VLLSVGDGSVLCVLNCLTLVKKKMASKDVHVSLEITALDVGKAKDFVKVSWREKYSLKQ